MTAPFDPAALAAGAGVPIALSDGRQLLAVTGDDAQRATMTGLVGKESNAVVADGSGLLAVSLPAGPEPVAVGARRPARPGCARLGRSPALVGAGGPSAC